MSTPPEPPQPGRQEDVASESPSEDGAPDAQQDAAGADRQDDAAAEPEEPRRRAWVLPVIGVVAILAVVAAIVVATRGGGTDPEPTANPATEETGAEETGETASDEATTEPAEDEREVARGDLEGRVDQTVIDPETETSFELQDGWSENADGTQAGARQAIEGVYTDGDQELRITAAAFETIEEHDTYADELVSRLQADGAEVTDEGPANEATGTGYSWVLETGEDPADTVVVWRTDDGVVLSLTGPRDAVEQVYRNMSI